MKTPKLLTGGLVVAFLSFWIGRLTSPRTDWRARSQHSDSPTAGGFLTGSIPGSVRELPGKPLDPGQIDHVISGLRAMHSERARKRAEREFVDALDEKGVQAAMASALNHRKDVRTFGLVHSLFDRWVELNPTDAMRFATTIPDPSLRGILASSALTTWADVDLRAAEAWVRDSAPASMRNELQAVLASVQAEQDPDRALAIALANPTADPRIFSSIFASLTDRDPVGAAAQALRLPTGRARQEALEAIANRWGELDSAAAIAWSLGLENPAERSAVSRELIQGLMNAEPGAAATLVGSIQDVDERGTVASDLAHEWSRSKPQDALRWVESLPPGSVRNSALEGVFSGWAENDPAAAANFALTLPDGTARELALTNSLQHWIGADYSAAKQWVEALPDEITRNQVLEGISWSGRSDYAQSVGLIALMIPGPAQDSRLEGVARDWARQDSASAMAWAAQQPDQHIAALLWKNIAASMAEADPQQALSTLDRFPPNSREVAVSEIAGQWASKDPGGAATWAQALPDPNLRSQITKEVLASWASSDPGAAAEWLKNIPDAPRRDNAIVESAHALFSTDPEAGLNWTMRLSNGALRTEQVTALAKEWVGEDPVRARRWIEAAELPEDLRRQLLAPGGQGR